MLPRRTRIAPTISDSAVQESEEGSPQSRSPRMPVPRSVADTLEPDVPQLQGDDKTELPKYAQT